MVCRSLLGVHRAHFHQIIAFPATSGRMPINFEKHQKFQKSPKFRFFAKIRFLMEWPILAGMMIYGRKLAFGTPESVFQRNFDIYITFKRISEKSQKNRFSHFFQDFLPKNGRNFGRSAGNRPNNVADPSGHIETFFRKKSLQ